MTRRPWPLLLALLALACQAVTVPSVGDLVAEPGLPPPTATPAPGLSRLRPLPPGQPIRTENWEVAVLDFLRGQAAWAQLQDSGSNEPPGVGEEYVLVQFHIRNLSRSGEEESLKLALTGSGLTLYHSFDAHIYPPGPYLDAHMAGGEEATGWYGYRIRQGETDLILVVEELYNYEAPAWYAALAENASVATAVEALTSITPTNIGATFAGPAPFGQIATGEDWQLTVKEVVRGDAAWQMAQQANQFNDPPAAGMEYVAVRLLARYIGTDEAGETIGNYFFEMMAGADRPYERVAVVKPEPELDYHFFPGGEGEGWVYLQAPAGAENLVLRFDPDYGADTPNTRYFSLVQYGR